MERPLPDRRSPQVAIASLPTTSSSFNSLFRVLCIFPLRYLCAIGLPQSCLALGGVYHPYWGCTFKQPDSLISVPLGQLLQERCGGGTGMSPSVSLLFQVDFLRPSIGTRLTRSPCFSACSHCPSVEPKLDYISGWRILPRALVKGVRTTQIYVLGFSLFPRRY